MTPRQQGARPTCLAAWPATGYTNCAWARKKAGAFFDNFINKKFISLQKLVGQDK
jgi:hypothetical protein